jgi:hypothetical protein
MYGEITWPLNCRYLLLLAVQMLLTSHYRLKRCLPTEAGFIVMQSNSKKKQNKGYGLLRESRDLQWLLRESLDLQNNKKGLGFHNIQHVYSLSRITLK